MDDIITLDYGSGGRKTSALIEEIILPAFGNSALNALGDGALIPGAERLAFSTDSFVVTPLEFPGGDIGKLAVCGTVNDVATSGAVPRYLSCGFVLEEGFPIEDLRPFRVQRHIRGNGRIKVKRRLQRGVGVPAIKHKSVPRGRVRP